MNRTWKIAIILFVALAIAFGSATLAKKPGKPCRPPLVFCLDVWDPVICDDGQVYSNQCYADRACATGCVPTGGGPVPF